MDSPRTKKIKRVEAEINSVKIYNNKRPDLYVASLSPIKLDAVKRVFPYHNIIGVDTSELVAPNQPIGVDQTKQCALARLDLVASPRVCISIENGIRYDSDQKIIGRDFAFICLRDAKGRVIESITSTEVRIPCDILKDVDDGIVGGCTWGYALKNLYVGLEPFYSAIDDKDPHHFVSGKHRVDILEADIRQMVIDNCIKPKKTIDHPRKGIVFYSYERILAIPSLKDVLFKYICKVLLKDIKFDVVAGIESRGFDIAATIAMMTGTSFVRIRKAGKLPPSDELVSKSYKKEYSDNKESIEMYDVGVWEMKNNRILVVDDIIATGGTMNAAISLSRAAGYKVVSAFAFARVNLEGDDKPKFKVPVITVQHL